MAHFLDGQRRFVTHTAHRTVGVGRRTGLFPNFRAENAVSEDWSSEDDVNSVVQIALVADEQDTRACQARALLEQALRLQPNLGGRSVEWRCIGVDAEIAPETDSVASFGHGFCVASRLAHGAWAAHAAATPTQEVPANEESLAVEAALVAMGHPLLDGVEAFASRCSAASLVQPSSEGTVLQLGRTATHVWPVAWTYERRHARVFSTLLGTSEDFQQPAFLRLALNALIWVS